MPSLPRDWGGGDNDEDEGDESESIEATRVAETILRDSTSVGGCESCLNGSAARDRDSVFSSNHSGESGAIPRPVPRACPRTLGPKRAHRVRQDRREYRQAPEAGPSGRAAHDRREFLPDQESSRLREGRTRGDTRRLQEMAMTTSDEAVYAVGQQGQQALDVQEDYWALLAEAPQD